MADIVDVENVLLATIAAAVYPNGTSQPSIVNADVKIYRGWPVAAQLDLDLQGQVLVGSVQQPRPGGALTNISIFSPPGMERNTTRFPRHPQVQTEPTHTLTASVNGNQVTIGGSVLTPQNVVILVGPQNDFAYQVQAGDTLASIAAALAALIAAAFPGSSAAGPVITIAGSAGLAIAARVGGEFVTWTEEKRQERIVQITLWCPTPAIRDALGPALDLALCENDFLTASDQSAIRLRYARTAISDEGEKVQIFRRDLFYTVEYPTASLTTTPETLSLGVTEQINGGATSAPLYS